jgi:hypothetical protein
MCEVDGQPSTTEVATQSFRAIQGANEAAESADSPSRAQLLPHQAQHQQQRRQQQQAAQARPNPGDEDLELIEEQGAALHSTAGPGGVL